MLFSNPMNLYRGYTSQLICLLVVVLSCLIFASTVHGASDVGWNLPPKTTAVVTGGTKGIGKVSMRVIFVGASFVSIVFAFSLNCFNR